MPPLLGQSFSPSVFDPFQNQISRAPRLLVAVIPIDRVAVFPSKARRRILVRNWVASCQWCGSDRFIRFR